MAKKIKKVKHKKTIIFTAKPKSTIIMTRKANYVPKNRSRIA